MLNKIIDLTLLISELTSTEIFDKYYRLGHQFTKEKSRSVFLNLFFNFVKMLHELVLFEALLVGKHHKLLPYKIL